MCSAALHPNHTPASTARAWPPLSELWAAWAATIRPTLALAMAYARRHTGHHDSYHTPPQSNRRIGSQRRVRVLLADDHTMFRQALRSLLEQMRGLEIVGEASNGRETVDMARQLQPDIVIMDISMPEMDGIEATRRIIQEGTTRDVVGLSMHQAPEMADKMYNAGARTYLTKDQAMEQLMAAVRAFTQAAAGE